MRFIIGILMLLIVSSCQLDNSQKEPKYTNLISSIDSLLVNTEFNGVIAIAKDTSIIYSKAIGYADLEKESRLEFQNQFVIGSISKQITAVLILRAFEKGQLKLEDTIDTYLKAIEQTWAKEVTIHHLLTHTHGIQGIDQALKFKPGTEFSYSQLGYDLLAQILESVTNKSFEVLSMDLFEAYDLNSSCHPQADQFKNLLKGYEQENGELVYVSNSLANYPAAGSFISNASDLIQWNYLLHSNQLLEPETLALMKTRYATREHPIFDTVEYGYGVLFKVGENDIQIGTLGYAPGFVSASYYYPKSQLNLVVLQNTAKNLNDFRETFKVHLGLMEKVKETKAE